MNGKIGNGTNKKHHQRLKQSLKILKFRKKNIRRLTEENNQRGKI